jgi:hypothetical protein
VTAIKTPQRRALNVHQMDWVANRRVQSDKDQVTIVVTINGTVIRPDRLECVTIAQREMRDCNECGPTVLTAMKSRQEGA